MFELISPAKFNAQSEVRVVLTNDKALLLKTPLKDKKGEELKGPDDAPVYADDDPGMDVAAYESHFDNEGLVKTKEGKTPTWWVLRKLSLDEQRQVSTGTLAGTRESKNKDNDGLQQWVLRHEFACELALVRIEGVTIDGEPGQKITISDENRAAILTQITTLQRQELGRRAWSFSKGLKPAIRAEGVTEGN